MINNIIKGFQEKHYKAKAQWHKDLLLIGTVILTVAIVIVRSAFVIVLYPLILLGIAIWEFTKELFGAIVTFPSYLWEEHLGYVPKYLRALRHIGNHTLPVNVARDAGRKA